jgi:phosphate transport system substrate-binding protein
VETDANALGYFPYAYYQASKDKLKLVAVDNGHGCVLPSARSVTDNTYQPLTRPLFLYVNVNAATRPWVQEFVHSYLNMGSTKTVSKVGYVPLTAAGLAMQTTRFDKGVTGSALGGHGSVVGVVRDWFAADQEDRINAQLAQ